ncbi:MAG TPA: hypothetical protein VG826_26035 [Pirellulales bacterium]|nr:hypothetical protein [Pirellulales bacterium]
MKSLIGLVALLSITYVSTPSPAADADTAGIAGHVATVDRSSEAWRFKFHRGRWWYWLSTGYWAVYEDGQWLMPVQGNPPPEAKSSSPAPRAPTNRTGASSPAATATNHSKGGSFAEDYPAVSLGQVPRQSADDHMSVGRAFGRSAHEHVQIMERYAASGETVPAKIVREQAAAIHHDVEQAQQSFSRVSMADNDGNEDENLPDAAAIKKLRQQLRKATESIRQLQSQVQQQRAVEAQLVRGQTAIISALLKQADEAADAAARAEAKREQEMKDRVGID